jgi:hypothetical protein
MMPTCKHLPQWQKTQMTEDELVLEYLKPLTVLSTITESIRITHVPIDHAVARPHDSTSRQTPLPRLPRIMKLPAPNLLSFSVKSTNEPNNRLSKKDRRAGKSQRYKYPPRLEIQSKNKSGNEGSRNRKLRPVPISGSSCRVELSPSLSGSRQQPYSNLTMINFDISRILIQKIK